MGEFRCGGPVAVAVVACVGCSAAVGTSGLYAVLLVFFVALLVVPDSANRYERATRGRRRD